MPPPTFSAPVDVELEEFDTDDLIDEVRSRGYTVNDNGLSIYDKNELIRVIYEKRRLGKDYQAELDQLILQEIGRIL